MSMLKQKGQISDQLRVAILKAGITRYRIAKETGVSQAALSKFVRGVSSLDLPTVDKLCSYLGLELKAAKHQRVDKLCSYLGLELKAAKHQRNER